MENVEKTNFKPDPAIAEEVVTDEKEEILTTVHDTWADNFARGVYQAQLAYIEAKKEHDIFSNELTLTTNWNEINEVRKEALLPKISNDSQRKAYIKTQCQTLYDKMMEAKAYYDFCKNNFDILLAREKYSE